MLPAFDGSGNLPPGVHWTTWPEFVGRYGTTPHRQTLLTGLKLALESLRDAGCMAVYVDGSFVTSKQTPGDLDFCWEVKGVDPTRLDPAFLVFDHGRAAQKAKFSGEFFPANLPEGASGKTFLEFFQTDRHTGGPKGIVAIDLRRLP